MINTYQTSLAPPPVPPRLSRSQPILIPASLPSQGHSKPLIRFLACAVVLHVLLSVVAFIFLCYKDQMVLQMENHKAEKQVDFRISEKLKTTSKTMAHMVVEKQTQTPQRKSSGYLQWNMKHSVRKNINYYESSWLTVLQPGVYYVYSKVTFSKDDPVLPLASIVKLRQSETAEEKDVMQAFCSLDSSSGSSSIPRMCTATQGELITLEKGNQLSVWVQDLSLVDYVETATAFGMYKL